MQDHGIVQPGDPNDAWFAALPESEMERRRRFGKFVKRAVDDLLNEHPELTTRTLGAYLGVSKATVYRWIKRAWRKDPEPSLVETFCAKLDIPITVAYTLLEWGAKSDVTAKPVERPAPRDPAAATVDELLADPDVSAADKDMLRGIIEAFDKRRST